MRSLGSFLLLTAAASPFAAGVFVGCAKDSGQDVSGGTGNVPSNGDGSIVLPPPGNDGGGGVPGNGGDSGVDPCEAGQKLCSGQCVDLQTHRLNCGSCGEACAGDEICNTGVCECPYTRCGGEGGASGGVCADTSTSLVHCGRCYNSCSLRESCVDGECSCEGENLTRCGSLCVDLLSDDDNCGDCGIVCEPTELCSEGQCLDDCQQPTTRCETAEGTVVCANLQTSAEHCGDCFDPCPAGQICNGGSCSCPEGTELCGSACIDTSTSLGNCGECNVSCAHICTGGVCVCEPGLEMCGTSCFDLQTNDAHCGACDTSCGTEASCGSGSCSCDTAGLTFCSGQCFDLENSYEHCGSCTHVCTTGQICRNSVCSTPPLLVRSKTRIAVNDVNPSIRLCNQSSSTQSLAGITIRYWYTIDGTSTTQIPTVYYVENPLIVTVTATRVNPARTGADFVLQISISGTPTLATNTCVEIQVGVHGTDEWYPYYDVTNDWSYLAGDYVVNPQISAYQNGNLVWGTEPPPL